MTFSVTNTFTNGTTADADEVNTNFTEVEDVINGAGTTTNFIVPIGAVLAWLKSYTNTPSLPANFVECNGQTLSDATSPYNGQTIPDLNGDNRFLRGNSTSGGTGGSETHTHTVSGTASASGGFAEYRLTSLTTGATSTLPTYYGVVWVMRIK